MMKRDFYSAPISEFQSSTPEEILGKLAANNPFTLETTQKRAWLEEISTLKNAIWRRRGCWLWRLWQLRPRTWESGGRIPRANIPES